VFKKRLLFAEIGVSGSRVKWFTSLHILTQFLKLREVLNELLSFETLQRLCHLLNLLNLGDLVFLDASFLSCLFNCAARYVLNLQ